MEAVFYAVLLSCGIMVALFVGYGMLDTAEELFGV